MQSENINKHTCTVSYIKHILTAPYILILVYVTTLENENRSELDVIKLTV